MPRGNRFLKLQCARRAGTPRAFQLGARLGRAGEPPQSNAFNVLPGRPLQRPTPGRRGAEHGLAPHLYGDTADSDRRAGWSPLDDGAGQMAVQQTPSQGCERCGDEAGPSAMRSVAGWAAGSSAGRRSWVVGREASSRIATAPQSFSERRRRFSGWFSRADFSETDRTSRPTGRPPLPLPLPGPEHGYLYSRPRPGPPMKPAQETSPGNVRSSTITYCAHILQPTSMKHGRRARRKLAR